MTSDPASPPGEPATAGAAAQSLSVQDHSRDVAGLLYVYPVVSRRAGGVSVGVNVNPNNACNWACRYCQVPGLTRGGPPAVDLPRLELELDGFLDAVVNGDYLARHVPEGARVLKDIAISGNGEPSTCRELDRVVEVIGRCMQKYRLVGRINLVMISNGSEIGRPEVQRALAAIAALGGEVWFKIDRATTEGMERVNGVRGSPNVVAANLRRAAGQVRTWVQTCMCTIDGRDPDEDELHAYLDFLAARLAEGTALRGVLLYGLARQSMQPGAERLAALPAAWLEALAGRIRALGLEVRVTP